MLLKGRISKFYIDNIIKISKNQQKFDKQILKAKINELLLEKEQSLTPRNLLSRKERFRNFRSSVWREVLNSYDISYKNAINSKVEKYNELTENLSIELSKEYSDKQFAVKKFERLNFSQLTLADLEGLAKGPNSTKSQQEAVEKFKKLCEKWLDA